MRSDGMGRDIVDWDSSGSRSSAYYTASGGVERQRLGLRLPVSSTESYIMGAISCGRRVTIAAGLPLLLGRMVIGIRT